MSQENINNLEKEKIREIMKRSKQFVIISGPSGSGKTMVIKHLVNNYGFVEPPFLTTRELRVGEQEIGGTHLNKDDFAKRNADKKIFLPAFNYGNAYGYDLDVIFNMVVQGKNIVVESPASNLITEVSHFLPEGEIIGILPESRDELRAQLKKRGLNNENDIDIRLLNSDFEKEHITSASRSIAIAQIFPTHGTPQDTLSQIDRVMKEKKLK